MHTFCFVRYASSSLRWWINTLMTSPRSLFCSHLPTVDIVHFFRPNRHYVRKHPSSPPSCALHPGPNALAAVWVQKRPFWLPWRARHLLRVPLPFRTPGVRSWRPSAAKRLEIVGRQEPRPPRPLPERVPPRQTLWRRSPWRLLRARRRQIPWSRIARVWPWLPFHGLRAPRAPRLPLPPRSARLPRRLSPRHEGQRPTRDRVSRQGRPQSRTSVAPKPEPVPALDRVERWEESRARLRAQVWRALSRRVDAAVPQPRAVAGAQLGRGVVCFTQVPFRSKVRIAVPSRLRATRRGPAPGIAG